MQPLTIAEGTPAQITVWDCRQDGPWARPSAAAAERAVYYHHTVDNRGRSTSSLVDLLAILRQLALQDRFGLPYNFLVVPLAGVQADYPILYLNDVDRAWPHTYAHNGAVAVAAQGNFDVEQPPAGLAHRMGAVTYALSEMWDAWIPERFHRDVFPTACPGRYLAAALAADGSYGG